MKIWRVSRRKCINTGKALASPVLYVSYNDGCFRSWQGETSCSTSAQILDAQCAACLSQGA